MLTSEPTLTVHWFHLFTCLQKEQMAHLLLLFLVHMHLNLALTPLQSGYPAKQWQESDPNCLSDSDGFIFLTGGSAVQLVPLTEDLAASPPADSDLFLPLPPENPTETTGMV